MPERFFEISSCTIKSTRPILQKLGRFSYLYASLPYYAMGIKSIALTKKQTVMIASQEKALCDKIIMTSGILLRRTKQVRDYLLEYLRMNEYMFKTLDANEINSWIASALKKESLSMLVKILKKL